MTSEVIVLQSGYSCTDENDCFRAACSVTLVRNTSPQYSREGWSCIIVDTGGAWEKDAILMKLAESKISLNDIDIVVGTHGHSDHVGNLNLFPKAKQIVGFDINVKDKYMMHDFRAGEKYTIQENEIEIIPTPGHTHADVSVIVRNGFFRDETQELNDHHVIGICGDLFEKKNDDEIWQTLSEDVVVQKENRKKMLELCDFIIPGHGPPFKVDR